MIKRDASGEFVRCILMLGICMFHASSFGIYPKAWWINSFYCFFDGFVILSGWYGMRFSWKKFFSLWWIGLACAIIDAVIYNGFIFPVHHISWYEWLCLIKANTFRHWYLNCYAVLMLLIPLVNAGIDFVVEHRKEREVFIPFFVLVFGWSWLFEKASRWILLPRADGLGSFTFLTLMGVYVVGRLLRKHEELLPKSKLPYAGMFFFGMVACICGVGWYASPFTVIGAIGLFVLLKKIKLSNWFAQIVFFVAPSTFSVYLLHEGPEGYWFVRMMNMDGVLGFVIIAISIFCLTVLFDVVFRRCHLSGSTNAFRETFRGGEVLRIIR